MIPKKIHYCWFGENKLPKKAEKCIESWKKYCPDYEIIEWNEKNFNINLNEYTKFTYENKLFAYLSDYVRLWVVEKYGGIYFDTDVELVKAPDQLLKNEAYFGFEGKDYINTGVGFGAIAHQKSVKKMLEAYHRRGKSELAEEFEKYSRLTGSPKMNTYALVPYGLEQSGLCQMVCGATIFSEEYFCPFNDLTGELNITENTVSIHWYTKSVEKRWAKIKVKFTRPIRFVVKKLRILLR